MSDMGPTPEVQRTNTPLIGAGIGLGIIGLVVLGALLFGGGDDEPVETATTTSTTVDTSVTSTSVLSTTSAPTTTVAATTSAAASTAAPTTVVSTTEGPATTIPGGGGGATALSEAPGPGEYCYQSVDGESQSDYRVTFVADGTFAGDARISVLTPSYSAFGIEAFDGTFGVSGGTNATAEVTTWIEADVQNSTQSWTFGESQLATRNDVLALTDCAEVDIAFQDVDGLEAADLFDGVTVRVLEEVKFAPGGSSGSVDNAVISGERDVYELEALSGQQLEVDITSLEDNAVFSVIGPGGQILSNGAVSVSLFLPHNGVYQVVIGPTRGNATYEATFSIL